MWYINTPLAGNISPIYHITYIYCLLGVICYWSHLLREPKKQPFVVNDNPHFQPKRRSFGRRLVPRWKGMIPKVANDEVEKLMLRCYLKEALGQKTCTQLLQVASCCSPFLIGWCVFSRSNFIPSGVVLLWANRLMRFPDQRTHSAFFPCFEKTCGTFFGGFEYSDIESSDFRTCQAI